MLTNPIKSMVINGNVAQSMTFNVYGNGNQPTDNIYFWVEMFTSPEIIILVEIDLLQLPNEAHAHHDPQTMMT